MNADELKKLITSYQQGNDDDFTTLFNHFLPMIKSLTRKIKFKYVDFDDAFIGAIEAFWESVKTCDTDRAEKFEAYASKRIAYRLFNENKKRKIFFKYLSLTLDQPIKNGKEDTFSNLIEDKHAPDIDKKMDINFITNCAMSQIYREEHRKLIAVYLNENRTISSAGRECGIPVATSWKVINKFIISCSEMAITAGLRE
jgi:DNA-directed RNA polymerase specialized sigma subunit